MLPPFSTSHHLALQTAFWFINGPFSLLFERKKTKNTLFSERTTYFYLSLRQVYSDIKKCENSYSDFFSVFFLLFFISPEECISFSRLNSSWSQLNTAGNRLVLFMGTEVNSHIELFNGPVRVRASVGRILCSYPYCREPLVVQFVTT